MIYLDTSALATFVGAQPETTTLRAYLANHTNQRWFTCALTGLELRRNHPDAHPDQIHTVMASLDTAAVTDRLLAAAAQLPTTVDLTTALHIAAAQTAGRRLTAFITFDPQRAAAAATAAALPVLDCR
ncbi:MAG: VapC toxin family PIN domain ribonuclease [Mycolicibacterium sp.]|uniref:VapC toxin family PIN domain ribonuclease n=1 Tax=Mycolicibacterium sp. TaxID=2320850 RepID=UPI003D09D20F